jgi:hypothetical protein
MKHLSLAPCGVVCELDINDKKISVQAVVQME